MHRDPNCKLCPLHATAQYVCLLGTGPKNADIFIVGEAPGEREDAQGRAFVGRAGDKLNEFLAEAGLSRDKVYISNAVHCRPPENRTPNAKEIRACNKWLRYELNIVKPKYILALGAVAAFSLIGQKTIGSLRGTKIDHDGCILFLTYHPAASLHQPHLEDTIRLDFRTFGKLIRGETDTKSINLEIVQDSKSLSHCIDDIQSSAVIGVDTETSGLNPFLPKSYITSIGIGTNNYQWTIPLNHTQSVWYRKFNRQKSIARRLLDACDNRIIVCQNGKFDSKFLYAVFGLRLKPTFDTLLAHHLLNENTHHDLEYLAQIYFGAPKYDITEEEKWGFGDLHRHCDYLGHDILYTRKLYFKLEKELRQDYLLHRLFYRLVMRVSWMYTYAEIKGIYVNPEALDQAEERWGNQSVDSLRQLDELWPSDNKYKLDDGTVRVGVNWNSPQQLADILFEQIGLNPIGRTKGGQWSTTEGILLTLAKEHDIPGLVLKHREANKMLSFIKAWRKLSSYDGRIHPHIKIHGTVAGRPSCEDPNLQQTPREKTIRSCFDAPEGRELLEADLSQAEVRLTAEYSGDRELIRCLRSGIDVHLRTTLSTMIDGNNTAMIMTAARNILGRATSIDKATQTVLEAGPDKLEKIDETWSVERKKNKAVVFGYIYGMSAKKFVIYAWEKFQLVFALAAAQSNRRAFFNTYRGLVTWHKHQIDLAKKFGFVRTIFGRKRRLPNAQLNDDSYLQHDAERQAINAPIQGSAVEWDLAAAVELFEKYEYDDGFDVILTVHDANIFEVDSSRVAEFVPVIREAMRQPALLEEFGIVMSVPMDCDVKLGPWGSGKKI